MGQESKTIGNDGEHQATEYLVGLGWKIIIRNFRSYHGEIDIIAEENDSIVFVEVKNYSGRSYYKPSYSISKAKKNCMIHAAKTYLMKEHIRNKNCRFDVITLYTDISGKKELEHYRNAFGIN